MFNMLADMLTAFKYMTLYSWIDAEKIAAGDFGFGWLGLIAYMIIVIGFSIAGIVIYRRKQLSL